MTTALHDVIAKEKDAIKRKRVKLGILEAEDPLDDTLLGVALSGGGMRAGVLGLGFLKTLNDMGLISRTDYLSSVSGGSLASGHLAARQQDGVFSAESVDRMRQGGRAVGINKTIQSLVILTNYFVGLLFSLSSLGIVIGVIYFILNIIGQYISPFMMEIFSVFEWVKYGFLLFGGVIAMHFVIILVMPKGNSLFIKLEIALLLLFASHYFLSLFLLSVGFSSRQSFETLDAAINAIMLFMIGFFTYPSRFLLNSYPKQFFSRAFQVYPTSNLKDLSNYYDDRNTSTPYFLFNTALSLKNSEGDQQFKGGQLTDHFILSPLFCGSKITGFVPTERYQDYGRFTLMDAIQISASKLTLGVRPEGVFKLLSPLKAFTRLVGKIFNFSEYIFWVSNPLILVKSRGITWWPLYYFKELLNQMGTSNKFVAISDGANFENLGIFPLLQRKCKIILALDSSFDPEYKFDDLRKLIVRAQNELGLAITFRLDSTPEELIAPKPTTAYSDQRYAIADVIQLWDDKMVPNPETGVEESVTVRVNRPIAILIYAKASIRTPAGSAGMVENQDPLKYGTYKYKMHNAAFPHEEDALNLITDPMQWETYFQLGQALATEAIMGEEADAPEYQPRSLTFDDLAERFKKQKRRD